MLEVRPAGPEDFERVYPLLKGFGNVAMAREDWRCMLFDLPWPVEEPHRGFMLIEGDAVVGFLGTIFSARAVGGMTRRFCNLSSWIVTEAHRASSLHLVLPVLRLKEYTIVNLTASPRAHEVFTGLGFRTLEGNQLLIPLLTGPLDILARLGSSLLLRPDEIRAALDPPGREIFDHMSGTRAAQLLIRHGDRRCHVVATRSPWKGRMTLAHVQYASDWDCFWERRMLVSWGFARTIGAFGLRVDGRRLRGRLPRLAVRRPLALPTLFRPADADVTPDAVDGLYTELVGQRW